MTESTYVSKGAVTIQPQSMHAVYISRPNLPDLPSFHQKPKVWNFLLTLEIFMLATDLIF